MTLSTKKGPCELLYREEFSIEVFPGKIEASNKDSQIVSYFYLGSHNQQRIYTSMRRWFTRRTLESYGALINSDPVSSIDFRQAISALLEFGIED